MFPLYPFVCDLYKISQVIRAQNEMTGNRGRFVLTRTQLTQYRENDIVQSTTFTFRDILQTFKQDSSLLAVQ
jgi:hypothetical protein